MTINRETLAELVAEECKLGTNSELARQFIDDILDLIAENLIKGDDVKISGFGNFIQKKYSARTGRNPKTLEEFPIPSYKSVSFRASSTFKNNIKNIQNKNNKHMMIKTEKQSSEKINEVA